MTFRDNLIALLACGALAGCATTPRENAENVCSFIFLASVPVAGSILSAALCAFGPSEIPDKEEDDVREAD